MIVLANGCFDLLHYGHLLHLEAAKRMGAVLVVSITDDAHVFKGPGRPIYKDWQRAALVNGLRCVDRVIIVSSLTEALKRVAPDILVKGVDYKDGLEEEHEKYCKEHYISIKFTKTPKLSATDMINESLGR